MDFGFVGTSYTTPSIYQDDQEAINFLLKLTQLKVKASVLLLLCTRLLDYKPVCNWQTMRCVECLPCRAVITSLP